MMARELTIIGIVIDMIGNLLGEKKLCVRLSSKLSYLMVTLILIFYDWQADMVLF